jgi:hypothetical protein
MAETDPYEHDPFFKKIHDADWNACIGRQGHEEHYLDGYIEAAIELADAIIEKRMFAKRDTLVLPILYNARHALELTLQFAMDVISMPAPIEMKAPLGMESRSLLIFYVRFRPVTFFPGNWN